MANFYVVRNPSEVSELSDIVWETTPEAFYRYCHGTDYDTFCQEQHEVFATRE